MIANRPARTPEPGCHTASSLTGERAAADLLFWAADAGNDTGFYVDPVASTLGVIRHEDRSPSPMLIFGAKRSEVTDR